MCTRYVDAIFTPDYVPTTSCERDERSLLGDNAYSVKIFNVVKKVNVPSDKLVTLDLWAIQSMCESIPSSLVQDLPARDNIDLRSTYYRDADAVIGWS